MPATDSDLSIVSKMYAINVLGPMRMVTHFHRMIIEVKGKIVNIGSIGGVTPYVYGSAYNGSKAALVHWGATLRVEMLPFGLGPLILHAEMHKLFFLISQPLLTLRPLILGIDANPPTQCPSGQYHFWRSGDKYPEERQF